MSLVQERGELVVNLGVEVFAREQRFQAASENCHRILQLMRGIGGISRRSFQFFAR
jgi:hypothetical protein